jgi:iron complex outermembrane recepter protein
MPSVVVNSDAGNGIGYTGISIRGVDAARINITLNGIPFNDAESQGTFFVNLPDFSSSVNSIQVQRGVGTSTNGAGAFGASIHLSTNEVNKQAYAEANNSYSSFNSWKNTVKLGTGLLGDHWTVDARLSRIVSDGFVDRGSSNLKALYLSGAYINASTAIRFNFIHGDENTFQSWSGVPEAKLRGDAPGLLAHYYNNLGSLYFSAADSINLFNSDNRKFNTFLYPNQTDNYQQTHYQFFVNHQFSNRLSVNLTAYKTDGKGYYEELKQNAKFSNYGLPDVLVGGNTIKRADIVRQLWLDNQLHGLMATGILNMEKHQLILGGGISNYAGKHFGRVVGSSVGSIPANFEWYRFDAQKKDWNAFAKWEFRIDEHWQTLLDLQYRQIDYDFAGTRNFPTLVVAEQYRFFNPKFGISYTHKNLTAFASIAVGQKEPNRKDFETGSLTQPKPEQLTDIEIGIGQQSSRYSWHLGGYWMNYTNQLVQTGKINDVGDAIRQNVASSYRLGVELEGSYQFVPQFSVSANISISQNRINNFYDAVPRYDANFDLVKQDTNFFKSVAMGFSPNGVANLSLQYQPFRALQIALINKYVGQQYLDNTANDQRQLNAWLTSDCQISYQFQTWILKQSSIHFRVNNLFNQLYEANGYTYSYIYDNNPVTENFFFPMAGTNFQLALNLKF